MSNATCILSGLPISSGTPCRVVFLRENVNGLSQDKLGSKLLYPYDDWQVVSFPLKGTYCDYSKAEIEDSVSAQFFMRWLALNLIEKPAVTSQYDWTRFRAITVNDLDTPEKVQEAILDREERVEVRMPSHRPGQRTSARLGFCFLREDAYQAMQSTSWGESSWAAIGRKSLLVARNANLGLRASVKREEVAALLAVVNEAQDMIGDILNEPVLRVISSAAFPDLTPIEQDIDEYYRLRAFMTLLAKFWHPQLCPADEGLTAYREWNKHVALLLEG